MPWLFSRVEQIPCPYRASASGYYALSMLILGGRLAFDLAQTFNLLFTRDKYTCRENSLSYRVDNPVTNSLVQASTHSIVLAHLN